ncbi:MAG: substrate-binding domain-containing protein [Clostridiales bacterium]|nr:substrate-binding domain-containing protein [Clostridiales bacterium]
MFRFLKRSLVFIVVTALFLMGCASTDEHLTFTESTFPRVDGSTANIPLGEAAAAVLMGIDRADAARFANFNGTDRSFRNLVDGNADVLIVYEPSEETVRTLGGLDGLNMAPIGYDGLVFIVNASNPVDSLTVEQVRDIYAGVITNWNEVGGPDAPIAPFQRNETAGSHALMVSLLMQDTPLMPPKQIYMFGGMGEMLTAVAEFDGGQYSIGYHVFYYVAEMIQNPNVKILRINDVMPTQETIGSGEYPLTNPFYAVIRADEPTGSPAYQMFRWLQSPEGQALIHLEGYAAIGGRN